MLQTLEIYALRGATEKFTLTFERGKKITILYGENGSGKSTICDVLELLCDGKVGSLDGKGLGKTANYWHSTGKRPGDLSVTLKTSQGQWEAKLVKAKAVIIPDQGRPRLKILRRSQLLNLIAAQPKERYDVIAPFIDISGVEQSEQSLRRLLQTEEDSRESASARIEENRAMLEKFWEQAGRPGSAALDWARAEAQKNVAELSGEIERLEQLIAAFERLLAEERRSEQSRQQLEDAENRLQTAAAQVEQEQQRATGKAGKIVEILTAAQSYFHAHAAPDACPLCGSAEFVASLPAQVTAKLAAIKSLADALQQQVTARQSCAAAQRQTEQQTTQCQAAANDLAQLLAQTNWPSDVLPPPTLLQAAQEVQVSAVEDFLPAIKAALESRQQQKGFQQSLKQALATYDANYTAQQEREQLLPVLRQALKAIEHERRQFVDSILAQIAQRVGELYEEIHPGEGLGQIGLLLDPARRASLDIQGCFPGAASAPPGAYFSESHLDTLGLCIWLALSERQNAAQTILALDDVIASVDDQHVDRIVEMLYAVSLQFQHCILTTHYRPWREKYRWGWLNNGQCHFVELLNWGHGSGITYGRVLPPVAELGDLLAAAQPSPQIVCASAGVMLEGILDFLTQLYECSVPRRKGKLTLGDLLPNINKKLRGALRVERAIKDADGSISDYDRHDLGPLLDELSAMAQLRNVFGCHFNDLAHYLPAADGLDFAAKVHELARLLIDVDAGWPMSDKSGSYWANAGDTVRLHPLRQPK
jgi:energy-coupling factor transporter ATP-binding protein EcfA2